MEFYWDPNNWEDQRLIPVPGLGLMDFVTKKKESEFFVMQKYRCVFIFVFPKVIRVDSRSQNQMQLEMSVGGANWEVNSGGVSLFSLNSVPWNALLYFLPCSTFRNAMTLINQIGCWPVWWQCQGWVSPFSGSSQKNELPSHLGCLRISRSISLVALIA